MSATENDTIGITDNGTEQLAQPPEAPRKRRRRKPRNGSAKRAEPAKDPTVTVEAEAILNTRELSRAAERHIFEALRDLSYSVAQSDEHIGAVRALLKAISDIRAVPESELADALEQAEAHTKGSAS